MLTNWKTISQSIRRLRELDARIAEGHPGPDQEGALQLTRQRDKLERALGGIKDMGGLPDLLFVIDTNKESIAVAEPASLSIPVVAVVDSNSEPDSVTYPVPGNDDASRAINLYCDLMVGAVLDGIQAEMAASGPTSARSRSCRRRLSSSATVRMRRPASRSRRRRDPGAAGRASPVRGCRRDHFGTLTAPIGGPVRPGAPRAVTRCGNEGSWLQ